MQITSVNHRIHLKDFDGIKTLCAQIETKVEQKCLKLTFLILFSIADMYVFMHLTHCLCKIVGRRF